MSWTPQQQQLQQQPQPLQQQQNFPPNPVHLSQSNAGPPPQNNIGQQPMMKQHHPANNGNWFNSPNQNAHQSIPQTQSNWNQPANVPMHFFDNVQPNAQTTSHQTNLNQINFNSIQEPPANNYNEPVSQIPTAADGWDEWGDWNLNDSKNQNTSAKQNDLNDSFNSNVNSNFKNQPLSTDNWQLGLEKRPPNIEDHSNLDSSLPSPPQPLPSLPPSANFAVGNNNPFKRSGQILRAGISVPPPLSQPQSLPLMTSSLEGSSLENQELVVPDNSEVLENIGHSFGVSESSQFLQSGSENLVQSNPVSQGLLSGIVDRNRKVGVAQNASTDNVEIYQAPPIFTGNQDSVQKNANNLRTQFVTGENIGLPQHVSQDRNQYLQTSMPTNDSNQFIQRSTENMLVSNIQSTVGLVGESHEGTTTIDSHDMISQASHENSIQTQPLQISSENFVRQPPIAPPLHNNRNQSSGDPIVTQQIISSISDRNQYLQRSADSMGSSIQTANLSLDRNQYLQSSTESAGMVQHGAFRNSDRNQYLQTNSDILGPSQQVASPNNDRNQYLHLNSENNGVSTHLHTPNNDRNQYLQTSHLSEDDFAVGNQGNRENISHEQDLIDNDNFPPPGLSRFVLGEPESTHRTERQADGEDNSSIQFIPPMPRQEEEESNDNELNIDITADRNLYLVPGEDEQTVTRIVTGFDNMSLHHQAEQREVDLDGESIDDQNNAAAAGTVVSEMNLSDREGPIEGANIRDNENSVASHDENETNKAVEPNLKDLSNISSGNDSENRQGQGIIKKNKLRTTAPDGGSIKKHEKDQHRRHHHRYDSEDDSEYSSDNRHRRDMDKRRRDRNVDKREDHRDSDAGKGKSGRSNEKYSSKNRDRYKSRYDADSKYETEGSTRYERNNRRGGSDRERDFDRYEYEMKRGEHSRRSYKNDGRRRVDNSDRDRDRIRDRDYERDDRYDRERHYNRRRDPKTDSYPRKTNSRNAPRDSDYEKDRYKDSRYGNVYQHPSSGYEYDAYAYYQQQQYYEQLRRTNPQAYAEWYEKYYRHLQSADGMGVDCRESVHSGRSSAAGNHNEKDQRQENLSQNLVGGGRGVSDINALPEEDLKPARLTPCKFINEHAVVSISSGILVNVKPRYGHSFTNVVKLLKFGPNDSNKKLFQTFPGPLVKGITHKKTVIEYCEEQIRTGLNTGLDRRLRSRQNSSNSLCSSLGSQANKSSFTLMWNLLILLLRQNGMVVGTDIAELLIKNQKLFPYGANSKRNSIEKVESEKSKVVDREMEEGEIVDDDNEKEEQNSSESVDSLDKSLESSSESVSNGLTEDKITEKFRNYLLYGNVNEALDWATDNNLWGHALFLASKVDRRSHANVMMKFANKLALNDPLQTLYQLMSGRCPSSVTSVQDDKWGDWRPHLAMILSNTTQAPELDRKSITTLGDSLSNRGDLFAAQFCYLMAQVSFGKYVNHSSLDNQQNSIAFTSANTANVTRLVLLGSSHLKSSSFNEFSTNDAIIMTEIYEYACSLNDDKFSIVEFQPYKFLLSTRLLDYGYHLKSLLYLEQISLHIQKDSSKYNSSFIEQVYSLADKLKFYDPVMEKTFLESNNSQVQYEEQSWLQNLRNIIDQTQLPSYPESLPQQEHLYGGYNVQQNLPTIEEDSTKTTEVFQHTDVYNPPLQQQKEVPQVETFQPPQYPVVAEGVQQVAFQQNSQYSNNYYDYTDVANQGLNVMQNQQQQLPHQEQEVQPAAPNINTYEYNNWGGVDSGNQMQQQQQIETPMPTISMPNTSGNKRSFYDDGVSSQANNAQSQEQTSSSSNANTSLKQKQNDEKSKSKKSSESQNSSNQNSGWFGGIWNKLSMKPKNQMILPDDKNPSIVWDPEKKKWVNTDADGNDGQEEFKPPPKLGGMPSMQQIPQQQPVEQQMFPQSNAMPQQAQNPILNQQQHVPVVPVSEAIPEEQAAAPKTSGLQSNMFKMQRNRTLKKSYVDVFNPSGAPAKPIENIMAPTLPPAIVPQGGFFIPSSANNENYNQYAQQNHDANPQFYNPNSYGGTVGYESQQ